MRIPTPQIRASQLILGLAAATPLLVIPACSGGQKGDRNNRGAFEVLEISTGASPIYPYRVREVDSFGQPTTNIIEINSMDDLKNNASGNNLVLPVGIFALGTPPKLPNGSDGNHFLKIRFSHDLDPATILSTSPGAVTNSYLTTAISILAYNSNTEVTTTLRGRGFVGGNTVINDGSGNLDLVPVIEDDGNGDVALLNQYTDGTNTVRPIPAGVNAGFPRGFTNANQLASAKTFVFVADTDNNLSTLESFPAALADSTLIRVVITTAVEDTGGRILEKEVCTATTVGVDNKPPDVLGFVSGTLEITPGNGQTGVNPTTPILVRFNKPVQPTDVGTFFDKTNLVPTGGGVTLNITIAANTFNVIYYADPLSSGDFCNYRVVPAYNLPGSNPTQAQPTTVTVSVNDTVIRDLTTKFLGNTVTTTFSTGAGPGIVNAPVAPDALYVGMVGARPGIKIVDLNGFGQTTGGYLSDPSGNTTPVFDWRNTTRFQFNPNIGAPGITPNLSKPTDNTASGLDAGSPGVFRLIQDSSGETLLLGAPVLGAVADIHIGVPLDVVFNNENINVNATRANHVNVFGAAARGNGISAVPHPNPPRLIFPPPNPSQIIFAEEPTANPAPPNGTGCVVNPINLLVNGNPDGPPALGLFGHVADLFNGPAPRPGSPPPPTPACPFSYRQQIGHFLYVLDTDNKQIVIVNSNRMTVLDTIRLPDPVNIAFAPNLRRLAVSNFSSGSITFIDTDPTSNTFHQILSETRVEPGPAAVSWQPDGEDILAVHPRSNHLTVINGIDFQVVKSVTGFLSEPIGIAITPRHQGAYGNQTALYHAYILNRTGSVVVYESGPDGVNGIGFKDIIGTVPDAFFRNPKFISMDLVANLGGVFVSHNDDLGNGMVSRLEMTSSPGLQPLSPNSSGFLLPPTFRQKEWAVTQTYGGFSASNPTRDLLSGRAPGEMATDDMTNFGDLPGQRTLRNGSIPIPPTLHSGKDGVKILNGQPIVPYAPRFIFISIQDRGLVDVFDISTAEKLRSIDMGGTPQVLSSYWRQ